MALSAETKQHVGTFAVPAPAPGSMCRPGRTRGCGLMCSAAPRRFAQALNATYGCVPSNADHCCLGLAQSSQLGQYGMLGLKPVNDACSHLPGCSYQARPARFTWASLPWWGRCTCLSACLQQSGG